LTLGQPRVILKREVIKIRMSFQYTTVNGYSIIKYYHMITFFDTQHTFYEIEGLDSDLLVGYNLLKKIGAVIDTAKGVIKYNGIEEKLNYDSGIILSQHSLTEENTILSLKEFILKKYFDEKDQISSESEMGNQSEFSLGYTNPEHAVVEKSVKNQGLEIKIFEHAVVEISDKNKS